MGGFVVLFFWVGLKAHTTPSDQMLGMRAAPPRGQRGELLLALEGEYADHARGQALTVTVFERGLVLSSFTGKPVWIAPHQILSIERDPSLLGWSVEIRTATASVFVDAHPDEHARLLSWWRRATLPPADP